MIQRMREHKYKAKRLDDNNEWVEGYYWQNGCGNHFIRAILNCDRIVIQDYEIDPETLCEFTEHRDSHKQNIYQNDIVAFWIGNEISCKELIWYCNEINCMTAVPLDGIETNGWDYYNNKYPNYNYQTFCLRLQDPWGDYSKIEVIGNIFDNPELLEVK